MSLALSRHPWLRRAIWAGLLGLVLLASWCAYLVRPQRLRARLLSALAHLPAKVDIGRVRLALPDALELSDFELIPQPDKNTPPDQQDAVRLRIARARVDCDLKGFLGGELRPRGLALNGVEVTIVRPADPSAQASQPVGVNANRWRSLISPESLSRLPPIAVENADLRLLATEKGSRRLVRRWTLRGSVRATGAGCALRLDRVGAGDEPLAVLEWDQSTNTLSASTGWVDLETVCLLLGGEWARSRAALDLRGRGRLEHIVLSSPADQPGRPIELESVTLRAADLRCSLPIEEPDVPPAQRFAQLSEVDLHIGGSRADSRPPVLHLTGNGLINGVPARFALAGRSPAGGQTRLDTGWLLSAELQAANLTLPTPEKHSAFLGSSRLPRPLRDFFRNYRPSGRVNVELRVSRDEAERWSIAGLIEPQGASICYYEFPYEFSDLHGRMRIADGHFYLEEITGRHGSAHAVVDGVINHAQSWSGFTLNIHATNLPLNYDLFAALPPKYHDLWQRAAPLGVCDVAGTVGRAEGTPQMPTLPPTELRLNGRLLAGSVRVAEERRLEEAGGDFTIAGGLMTIHEMRGHLNGATLRVAGALALDDSHPTNLLFEAAGNPLHHTVRFEAPDGQAGELRFVGRGDVWGRINSVGPPTARHAQYTVHITDGVLTGFDPAGSWEQCEAWVNVGRDRQDVRQFRARRGEARLEAHGSVLAAESESPACGRLDVTVSQAPIEELVNQFVPPWWREPVESLRLSGTGEVRLQLDSGPSSAGRLPAITLHLSAQRMQPTLLPVQLHEIHARTAVTADGIQVHEAQAQLGAEGQLHVRGAGRWADSEKSADFTLAARNVEVSADLVEAMPDALAQLLKRLSPRGRLEIGLDRVHLLADRQGKRWELVGQLALRSGELAVGLPLTELDGTLAGTCTVQPDGQATLTATLALEHGKLAGRPIAGWEGTLRRQADDTWVYLEDLRGKLCGGEALGSVRIEPSTDRYELSLTLRDVSLAELLPPKLPTDTPRRGRLEGHIFLRGVAGELSSRTGDGELRIRGASILQTPVLADLAESKRQGDQPFSDALDLAELRFLWKGSTLDFTRLDIQSRDLRLVGAGTWNLRTDALDLTLVGAHPRHWPRVAVLTDLLETAGQELVQYRVRGTVAAPHVSAEPLYRLNETLRALLTGQ